MTVVFNCFNFIADCIESVIAQDYADLEHIIVDGGSTDGTVSIIKRYQYHTAYFISEPDKGMYDALNKGIAVATGDIIGTLNADDWLAGNDVVSSVVAGFVKNNCDAVYGNINFIARQDPGRITRRWKSKPYSSINLEYGWMPAHPTLYMKRELYLCKGLYSLDFGTCADYELILRFLYKSDASAVFLNKLMVVMRNKGMSNGSFAKIFAALLNDYHALVCNKLPNPLLVLFLKKIRKVPQFLLPNPMVKFI